MMINGNTGALLTFANTGTGTVNSIDQTNISSRGIILVVDLTTVAGGATCTVHIQGKDPVSLKYYDLLVSAALGAVATTILTVYPGCIASANVIANSPLPKTWRVQAVIGTATLGAGTIAGSLIQ